MQQRHLHIGPISSIHFRRWVDNYTPAECIIDIISLDNVSIHQGGIDRHVRYPLPKSSSSSLLTLFHSFLYLFTHAHTYDIVHIHSVARYSLYFLPCLFLKAKIIATPWGSDLNFSNILTRAFQHHLFRISHYITTDALFFKRMLISRYNVEPKKIKIINFGVQTSLFPHKQPISNSNKVIVSLRNHEPVYCIDQLVKAFLLILPQLGDDVLLHIYGSGSLTPALKRLVPPQHTSRIVFLGRFDSQNLPNILSSASIYVNTSTSDAGLASSTQEALAAGLPIVSTDVCDNAFWLDPTKCDSILYVPRVETLASILLEAINRVQKDPSWGIKNQAYANAAFSVDSQRHILNKIYH